MILRFLFFSKTTPQDTYVGISMVLRCAEATPHPRPTSPHYQSFHNKTEMASTTLSPPVILDESRRVGWGNKGGGFFKNKAFKVLLGATLPLIFLLLSNFRSLVFLDDYLPNDDDNNVHQQQYNCITKMAAFPLP